MDICTELSSHINASDIIYNDNADNEESIIDNQVFKFLEMLEEKKKQGVPEPTKYVISTQSAKCKFTKSINLRKMAEIFQENIINREKKDYIIKGIEYGNIRCGYIKNKNPDKRLFDNQATVIIKPNDHIRKINIKIFLNGSVTMTGCKNENDGNIATNLLVNEINKYPEIIMSDFIYKINKILKKKITEISNKEVTFPKYEKLMTTNYIITLINCNYSLNFRVDRYKLYNILIQKYGVFVTFDPVGYPGVKIGYMWNSINKKKNGICNCSTKCKMKKKKATGYGDGNCKTVTIAIFQSGNIIITGSRKIEQTDDTYKFINNVVRNNYLDIVRFSILDIKKPKKIKRKT